MKLDCAACSHCLDAMQQSLDKELEELNQEEAMYSAIIKEAAHAPPGFSHHFSKRGPGGGGATDPSSEAIAELEASRVVQEEALRALEEQVELSEAEAAGLRAELEEIAHQELLHEEAERQFWQRLLEHELRFQEADDEVGSKSLISIVLRNMSGLDQG